MVQATEIKRNFLPFFRLLCSSNLYIDVAYKGKAYRMYVEDLGERAPTLTRQKKRTPESELDQGKCVICAGITLGGLCIKADCSGSLPPEHKPKHKARAQD